MKIDHHGCYRIRTPRRITRPFILYLVRENRNKVHIPVEGPDHSLPFSLLTSERTKKITVRKQFSQSIANYPALKVYQKSRCWTTSLYMKIHENLDCDNIFKQLLTPADHKFQLMITADNLTVSVPLEYLCQYDPSKIPPPELCPVEGMDLNFD